MKKWAKDNPDIFYNYRNGNDAIGGLRVTDREFAIIIDMEKTKGWLIDGATLTISLAMNNK
ncbi:hypothetical protein A5821_003019 [Enterococcus sp. 7F3_DIV0205]|uniref:Uncharacterized protein n=1 Tax=Candidatus Enterococcus palustris TaxID=1834189 RepID=A0AAQ3WC25_9ENTE|nr:hypothetical protein [Enterococcus sp. 7F3_DIV0205]OTN83453.1 hypothetical protein A5821_003376 [Enterococcus sp. 7F3_DIV0205]